MLRTKLFVWVACLLACSSFSSKCGLAQSETNSENGAASSAVQELDIDQEDAEDPSDNEWLEDSSDNPASGFAQSRWQDLRQLEEMAIANNPALSAMAHRVQAARSRAIQAGLYPNPTVGLTSEEVGNDDTAGLHTAFFQKTYVRGGKIEASKNVACIDIDIQQMQLRRFELQLLTRIRQAYFQLLVLDRRKSLIEKRTELNQRLVSITEKLVKASEASDSDLSQVQIEKQKSETSLQQVSRQFDVTLRRLSVLSGVDQLAIAQQSNDALYDLPDFDFDQEIGRLYRLSPRLSVIQLQQDRAEAMLRKEYSETLSDVTGQFGVGYDTGTENTFASFQFSAPLQVNDRNQGNIAAARAGVTAAQFDIQQVQLDLETTLGQRMGEYQNALFEFQQYSEVILPRAQDTIDILTTGFEAGEIGFTKFIFARQNLFQLAEQRLNALDRAWQVALEIEGLLVLSEQE